MSSRKKRESKDAVERIAKEMGISKNEVKKKYVTKIKDMDFLNW